MREKDKRVKKSKRRLYRICRREKMPKKRNSKVKLASQDRQKRKIDLFKDKKVGLGRKELREMCSDRMKMIEA